MFNIKNILNIMRVLIDSYILKLKSIKTEMALYAYLRLNIHLANYEFVIFNYPCRQTLKFQEIE